MSYDDADLKDAPAGGVAEARPATYRDVFAVTEFRAVFAAGALSSIGDYLGKAALAAVIFQATGSVLASAASLAVTFLPWLTGAPVLVALAERYPYRRVLLGCDLGRMTFVALAALPGLPTVLVPLLMFLAALLSPAFDSSRSALLPRILTGDRYAVGLSINGIVILLTQVLGYAAGGLLSAVDPRMALGVDAATFGLSALLIRAFVQVRRAAASRAPRRNLLRETAEGFSVVFGRRELRSIAILVLCVSAFAILPEGLAAGWADALHGGSRTQGLIMAAGPVGAMAGGLVIGRLVPPAARRRLICPLAMVIPVALASALFDPPLPFVLALTTAVGVGLALTIPANVLFVGLVPDELRARAFGVMQGGLQLVEGAAILLGGALASWVGVSRAAGLCGLAGIVALTAVVSRWPKAEEFNRAIDR